MHRNLSEDGWSFDRCVVVKAREMISELTADGWFQIQQSGSHRIFRHAEKKGSVSMPGALGILSREHHHPGAVGQSVFLAVRMHDVAGVAAGDQPAVTGHDRRRD